MRNISIMHHLAHRRFVECGAHMWCLSSWHVVYQCSAKSPTLHKPSVCQVADDMECGRIHRYIACHELYAPHVCPIHPSVCQVADDMECARIHRYIACHEPYAPHVCPTHPSVCQVADDMECARIYSYIACHKLNTPHVCPTLHILFCMPSSR